MGFSSDSDGEESVCNAGDLGSIPGSGRSPGGGHGNPLQYSCLEFHGQRSLVSYSPWGCKESDATEQPILSLNVLNKNLLGKESGFKKFSRCLIDSHG